MTSPNPCSRLMSTATEDLFTPIHKGLRAMLYGLSTRLQTNDFADVQATNELVTDLENDFAAARTAGCVLCVLAHHAEDEEGHIFGSVSPFAGDLVSGLIQEHHELTRQEMAIGRTAHEILVERAAEKRIQGGVRLNQAMNQLFVAYCSHMNREESELVPLMQRHFTNEQMAAMRGAIIAGLPPDRLMAVLAWMLPALNVTELTDLMNSVGRGAPPPVLNAVKSLCDAKVDPARWKEVLLRTGL